MSEKMRSEFEAAVIARMKEGGFLEIEVRVEMLGRNGEGYWDCSVDTYWHYWQTSRSALCVELPNIGDYVDRYGQGENCDAYVTDVLDAIHASGVKTK